MSYLSQSDPTIARLIRAEAERQADQLEMIASENLVSQAVLEAMGSCLTNKYAEGIPGKRYYGGCEVVDEVEDLCRQRARELFQAEYVNVQPHSGAQANMAVYFAMLQPGDTVLGLKLPQGGHLTHGNPVNFSGMLYNFVGYGVDPETEQIDYDALQKLAEEKQPKMIVAGASAYPRVLDFARFREIADSVGALLMVDMAHIAGLVAAGVHPSPFPHAHFVTTTTHKTLRGPRGGLAFCKQEYAKELDKSVFPGVQGGPLMHVIAAKAVALGEALQPEFVEYQKQVVRNAKRLAEVLSDSPIRLVSGGTDTHLLLLDVRGLNLTGKQAEEILGNVGITVNKNTIPFDPQSPFITSGIRIGTPALTSRNMKEEQMTQIGQWIIEALTQPEDDQVHARIREEVRQLSAEFPMREGLWRYDGQD